MGQRDWEWEWVVDPRGLGALGACGERGVFCLETEEQAPTFLGRDGNGAMANPGQAGSLGAAHAETSQSCGLQRSRARKPSGGSSSHF